MKTLSLVLAIALVVLVVPTGTASHCCGPCTHEWAELVLAVPGDHKQGGFSQALGNAGARAGGCLDNGAGWDVCEIVRCDAVTLSLP